jgi:hypothetical protein
LEENPEVFEAKLSTAQTKTLRERGMAYTKEQIYRNELAKQLDAGVPEKLAEANALSATDRIYYGLADIARMDAKDREQ